MFETIRSLQNTRVKHLVRLRDGSHRRRQSRFLIEGQREIERALATGWPLETLYFCEELFKDATSYALLETLDKGGIEIVRMTIEPFRKCAYRQGPDGLLAVGEQRAWELEDLPLSKEPLLVILEGIEKPGNLGAIFRTANAAGVEAIILTERSTDPFNPNVIRASQGAFFEVPFACTGNRALKAFLSERNIPVLATSPAGKDPLWEPDLRGATAFVFGREDEGLSEAWMKDTRTCFIPMRGITDSLNVSAATAVCLFEAVRQRQS